MLCFWMVFVCCVIVLFRGVCLDVVCCFVYLGLRIGWLYNSVAIFLGFVMCFWLWCFFCNYLLCFMIVYCLLPTCALSGGWFVCCCDNCCFGGWLLECCFVLLCSCLFDECLCLRWVGWLVGGLVWCCLYFVWCCFSGCCLLCVWWF